MKFGAKGELLCSCAIPILSEDDVCANCRRKLTPERLTQFKGLKNLSNELPDVYRCEKCNNHLVEGQMFCAECGEKVKVWELLSPDKTPDNCEKCGASLLQNQKFCSACGWEVKGNHTPKKKVYGSSTSRSKSTATSKTVLLITSSLLGFLVLIAILGALTSSGSQQEECFEREMTKFGAFADPKGWAVQSRLYCQSLYP